MRATSEHPFWVVGKGWVTSKDLKVGQILLTKDNKQVPITGLAHEVTSGTPIYNLSVEGNHNYFVTTRGILTHNKSCFKSTKLESIFDLGDNGYVLNLTRLDDLIAQRATLGLMMQPEDE